MVGHDTQSILGSVGEYIVLPTPNMVRHGTQDILGSVREYYAHQKMV